MGGNVLHVGKKSNCWTWKALQGIVNPVVGNVCGGEWKRGREKVQTLDHLVACWLCFGTFQAAFSETLPGSLHPKDCSHCGRGYTQPGPLCLQHCPPLCISPPDFASPHPPTCPWASHRAGNSAPQGHAVKTPLSWAAMQSSLYFG